MLRIAALEKRLDELKIPAPVPGQEGKQGLQGPKGDPGQINKVEFSAFLLEFLEKNKSLLKGDKGDSVKGDKGESGKDGENGKPGTITVRVLGPDDKLVKEFTAVKSGSTVIVRAKEFEKKGE
mgnify:CR=1 FL=1